MHRVNQPVLKTFLLVLYIGTFSIRLNAAPAEPDLATLQKNGTVYVEPSHVEYTKVNDEYKLTPYRERRGAWGFTFGAGYSTYEPVRYESNFPKAGYTDVYQKPYLGMLEGYFSAKRNLTAFSVGGELAVGSMKNENAMGPYDGLSLGLTEIRLGGILYLDAITPEPFIVPYVSGGAYMMIFKENLRADSGGGNVAVSEFGGNTTPAFYLNGGAQFSIDWIDRHAARVAYEESGVLSSYLFAEARKYFASSAKKDPNFSNDVSFAGGLRVEF